MMGGVSTGMPAASGTGGERVVVGVTGEVVGHAPATAALGGEIQLVAQRLGELAHHLVRAEGAQGGMLGFGRLRQPQHQAQVGLDHRADAGPAHLDDDLVAFVQPGPVHLRQRGGGQRRLVESREHLLGWASQVLGQLLADVGERDGAGVVLQPAEFGDPFRLEQVDPGGEHLSQLDECRAQLLQRAAHACRRGEVGVLLRVLPAQRAAGALQAVGQAHAAHHVAEAVADQDRGDVVEPTEVAHRGHCLPQHQRSLPLVDGAAIIPSATLAARRASSSARRRIVG
jgi:hypothetical protein